jgi:hypothetical protein
MKSVFLPLVLGLPLVWMLACGGNSTRSGATAPSTSTSIGISGAWNIKLSTHQASVIDPAQPDVPTQMNIMFKQLTEAPSMLELKDSIYLANAGCDNGSGDTWWDGPDFLVSYSVLLEGSVVGGDVGFKIHEYPTIGPFEPSGTLIFTGKLNSDGTMSGDVIDGCARQPGTWTASRIEKLH